MKKKELKRMLVEAAVGFLHPEMEDHHFVAEIECRLKCSREFALLLVLEAERKYPNLGIIKTGAVFDWEQRRPNGFEKVGAAFAKMMAKR